ncbi:hypothetical protein SAMN05660642_04780 [Geodermatophilus siccatus]|uniref:Uncharacterized protein n=1 Tax=Geodermatophilus siccatus TaxID=1137991 RepID=A0A1H0B4V5_9ACTN|nr:hypothetical protein [Geodermatophilus siccatus]SDN40690.1 hypothetical protein SAMN05660642_04780 [Geodermatophilus siccatus]
MTVPLRFRQVNDYAWAHRFLSGFPNFHEANYGQGVVRGTFLLGGDVAEWRDIRAADLGNPPPDDVGARFRATNDWAARNGYVSGFPNFHQANYGAGTVYGSILIRRGGAEWRDVPAAQLGNPPAGDVPARFRATNDWAVRNGFAAGFPNFHQANYGAGIVYGTILFRPGSIQWRDVFAYVTDIYSRFRFDPAITAAQRQRLFERHSFALTRHASCGNLTPSERANLLSAYGREIWHGINTDPSANASAQVGGSQIWVNFTNLFPQNDNEVAQTLIHEMMHCAGYSHPVRRDPPNPTPDVPGDNGPYYGTPPLRSEFCIAGFQSDRTLALGQDTISAARPRACTPDGDVFTVASEVSPSIQHFSDRPEDEGPAEGYATEAAAEGAGDGHPAEMPSPRAASAAPGDGEPLRVRVRELARQLEQLTDPG